MQLCRDTQVDNVDISTLMRIERSDVSSIARYQALLETMLENVLNSAMLETSLFSDHIKVLIFYVIHLFILVLTSFQPDRRTTEYVVKNPNSGPMF